MKTISLPGKTLFLKCACFCFFVLVITKQKPQQTPKHNKSVPQNETTTRGPVIKYLLEDFSDMTIYC